MGAAAVERARFVQQRPIRYPYNLLAPGQSSANSRMRGRALFSNCGRLRKLSDGRLYLPAEEPYLEGHNTWCVNVPGSLLVIPVADIAQHLIAILCFSSSGKAWKAALMAKAPSITARSTP